MNNEPMTGNEIEFKINEGTPYIFLAEDDIDDQSLLIEALTTHAESLKIHTATNGKKAAIFLEALADSSLPCLIVLDYNLPEIDGGELLQILSSIERFHAIPKVVWSTSNSPKYQQICLQLGAKAYFVKPNDVDGIQKLAKEMLSFCDDLNEKA